MAGDFLQKIHKDFDRKQGKQHNLLDNMHLLRTFAISKLLEPGWRQWWIDALLFDALIGNTDRHQDNWGFIFRRTEQDAPCRLAPLFDNGTSLGHERFTDRVDRWTEADYDRYVSKGTHQLKWSLSDPVQGHISLLQRALDEWPDTRKVAGARLNFSFDELSDAVADLARLAAVTPLTSERFEFMLRLLACRLELLRALF